MAKHQVDRQVAVEQLIKCKMQDNLDFLQWAKRHWDQYYPGGEYDALARRKGSGAPVAAAPRAAATTTARRPAAAAAAPRTRTPGAGAGPATAALKQENEVLKETVQGLERERDFYFSKLRDIELLIQQAMEAEPELEKDENGILKQIQTILYSTEVGYPDGDMTEQTEERILHNWLASRKVAEVIKKYEEITQPTSGMQSPCTLRVMAHTSWHHDICSPRPPILPNRYARVCSSTVPSFPSSTKYCCPLTNSTSLYRKDSRSLPKVKKHRSRRRHFEGRGIFLNDANGRQERYVNDCIPNSLLIEGAV